MSSWNAVYQGLRNQVITALGGLVSPSSISIGYFGTPIVQSAGQPSEIMDLANQVAQSPMVSLYDRGMSRDVTRWIPHHVTPWEVTPASVTFAPSSLLLSSTPNALAFLTSAAVNDAVALNVSGFGVSTGAVYVASGAMSAAAFCEGLADVINSSLQGVLSATASGATLLLTNDTAGLLNIVVNSGNVASAQYEVHRTQRNVQVIAMANRPSTLDTIGEPLAQLFGELEITYGYELLDTTWVRLINKGDIVLWDNVTHNIARRDWMLTLEYGVDITDAGYPVLAPILSQQTLANGLG